MGGWGGGGGYPCAIDYAKLIKCADEAITSKAHALFAIKN